MSLSLTEIIGRDTPLDWFESVAIVQAVCAAVPPGAGGQEPAVPDVSGVRIAASGTIAVSGSASVAGSAVQRAARLLTALLPETRTPVPLRLLALTAVSGPRRYGSLGEFSRALDYFERPDRQAVIAAVYERAATLAPRDDRRSVNGPAARPQQATPAVPAKRKLHAPAWLPAVLGFVCATALLVVLAFAGWWWWWTPPPGQPKTVAAGVSTALHGIERQLAAILPAAIVPTGWAAEAPAAQVAEAPAEPAREPSAPRARARKPAVATPAPRENAAAEAPTVFSRIYSAADPDVVPPVALRSTLPTSPPPGVQQEELSRAEVVVTETGDVESVRLTGRPRRAIDGMLLSAIKTWKFQPATKDGQPVAYRHVIWLTSF